LLKHKRLYIRAQKPYGLSDLQMATRYVHDVSKQTDRVIENSRMHIYLLD